MYMLVVRLVSQCFVRQIHRRLWIFHRLHTVQHLRERFHSSTSSMDSVLLMRFRRSRSGIMKISKRCVQWMQLQNSEHTLLTQSIQQLVDHTRTEISSSSIERHVTSSMMSFQQLLRSTWTRLMLSLVQITNYSTTTEHLTLIV